MRSNKTLFPVLVAVAGILSLSANGAAHAASPNITHSVYTPPHFAPVANGNGGHTTYLGVHQRGDGRVVHIYQEDTKGVRTFHWIAASPGGLDTHRTATNPTGQNSSFKLNPGRP
jgi:hypothetical protein